MKIAHEQLKPTIANILRNSIEENFEQNGRFGSGILGGGSSKWAQSARAKKQGGKTLQSTGQLAASMQVNIKASGGISVGVENNSVSVKTDGGFEVSLGSNKKVNGVPLAAIHHFGGKWSVPVTKRMKSFFWAMFQKTKDDKYKFMALSPKKSFNIAMPARPLLVVQDEDIDFIWEKYVEWFAKNV